MGDVDNTAMRSPCLNLNIDKLLVAESDATVKVPRSRTWDGTRKVFGMWYSQSHGEARPFFFSLVSPLFMAGVTARPAMRPIICSPQGTHHAGLLHGGCERDLCTRWITLSLCKLGDLERSSRGNRWGSEFVCVCVCCVCLSVCLCVSCMFECVSVCARAYNTCIHNVLGLVILWVVTNSLKSPIV